MATMRRETTKTKRRINRRKLALIQGYTIIAIFVLIGSLVGFGIGRVTAPEKVKTVMIKETLETPTYDQKLPETNDVTYFDVPLSKSLQRYIQEVCADEGVPYTLAVAMIQHESGFNPEVISSTDDYGLMQINKINHDTLAEQYRTADMLDPYQNVYCGVKVIGSYLRKYEDYNKALMAYNMGEYGAKKAWENGYDSSSYSKAIVKLMSEYEQEVKENAGSNRG